MPAGWDAPVYLENLQPPMNAYLSEPLNTLLRQPPMSVALLLASVMGVTVSARQLWRGRLSAQTRAEQTVWLWAIITLALIVVTTPLNWQRYFLPLLPASRLFAALGVAALAQWGWARVARYRTVAYPR